MEILEKVSERELICGGEWFQCATQVLVSNGIHPFVFSDHYLLTPLKDIFQTFSNQANDKYGWVGAEKAEVIFLNDFRWTSDMIKWNDFLVLLEDH